MRIDTPAIVCALLTHGEHGAIVRLLTPRHGLQAAYVRGARGRRMRPVLIPGNRVHARLASRTEAQLPQAEVELTHSCGPLLGEPLPAAAIEWAAALTATALPEAQPYPRLYQGLDGVLAAIEVAPSASGWGEALVRYELLMLAELGFGLDLDRCAANGASDSLTAVSPKSGKAINSAEAELDAGKLLPLPAFLLDRAHANWPDIIDGLRLTGHFLMRDVLTERAAQLISARERLVDRLRRAAGLA